MREKPRTKVPALGQAWLGDWRTRTLERLYARDFESIAAFADSKPTASLLALAEELSTDHSANVDHADVCAEQVARLWREEAERGGSEAVERMARRILVGELHLDLPYGWLKDWAKNEEAASRVSMVLSSWESHIGDAREGAAGRVVEAMLDEGRAGRIPQGWLPSNADDPILVDIFERYWRDPS
jgi:hypothetical protein